VKYGGHEVTDSVKQRRGVGVVVLSPCLSNIFIDDVMDAISEGNVHAPAIEKMSISGLLFANDLAIGSFAVNGLERGID
jgi:hypothetical protein